MKSFVAVHRCHGCGLMWNQKPGPSDRCRRCGSFCNDWLNYGDLFKDPGYVLPSERNKSAPVA